MSLLVGSRRLLLLVCVGVGNALVDLGLFTLMARLAPDDVLARVFGVLESLIALTVGLGSIVTSLMIGLFGVRMALAAIGVLGPIFAAAAWHRLHRLDRFIGVRDREIEMLRAVPMLNPLPLPAIEHLARGLQPVSVPGGTEVFRQGDVGDRYYVVESGAAEVIGDGRLVATLGPGDAFGEIALLRRVPRTATVRAASELRLQTLTSDHFLPVILGYTPSAREAGAMVDTMLDRFTPRDHADEQDE